MYYRDIETSTEKKQQHDKDQKASAAMRLKKNAEYNRKLKSK